VTVTVQSASYRVFTLLASVNPLVPTLQPHSNGPLYSNTVTGTRAVDGWAVTFGTARRELGAQSPLRCTKCNNSPINGQCTNFILFDMALPPDYSERRDSKRILRGPLYIIKPSPKIYRPSQHGTCPPPGPYLEPLYNTARLRQLVVSLASRRLRWMSDKPQVHYAVSVLLSPLYRLYRR